MMHDRHSRAALAACLVLASLWLVPRAAAAQTDFYNLDRGRPLRTEDALVIERHALEWQVAPLRLSGGSGRGSTLGLDPELAWGVLPRTQLEIGAPLVVSRTGGMRIAGAGVDVSVLHALNTETLGWPGLAVSVGALLPTGALGPSRTVAEVGAIATRTTGMGRLHLNGAVTPGAAPARSPDDLSRWRASVAVDRTWAVRSLLVGGELVAEEALGGGGTVWSAGVGARYQLDPRSAVDLGLGRQWRGDGAWYVTMGSALSFGLLHRFGGVR